MRGPGLNNLPRRDPERRSSNHTWIFFEVPKGKLHDDSKGNQSICGKQPVAPWLGDG
jgi:hypothetical protein